MSVERAMMRIEAGRKKFAPRRAKMREIRSIREGRWEEVAPGLFPMGDMLAPPVANFIDVAAQASAEDIAPLPSFSCTNPKMSTDAARRSADRRTKVVNYYIQHSRLGEHNIVAADRLNTYGFCAYRVEPDFDAKLPCIYIEDSIDALYGLNAKGETIWYASCFRRSVDELAWEFESYHGEFSQLREDGVTEVEVIRYYDADEQLLMVPQIKAVLARLDNPIGKCMVRVVERPKLGETPRGAYDDLPWVQLARAMMAQYTLRIADQVANAPLMLPDDVQDVELGADAIMRSQNPNSAKRLDLSVPNQPFVELQNLATELRTGARHSEAQDGSIDASIITGKGVEALMGGYNTRIKTLQGRLASAHRDLAAICFEVDEKLWGSIEKSVDGTENGAAFTLKYRPSRDIDGNYNCNVSYGLTAGLDPNRALVFILQAETAGLISKDTARRELPFDIEAEAERDRILVEQLRESLLAGVAGLPQTLPALAMQGGDPTEIVRKHAALIDAIQKGTSIEEAVLKAFAPPPPEQTTQQEPAASGPTEPQDPMAALGAGVPQAGGPADDLLMALAGTTPSGNPNLSFTASMRRPI